MVEEMSLFHISYDSGIVSVGRMYPAGIALKYMSLFILTKIGQFNLSPLGHPLWYFKRWSSSYNSSIGHPTGDSNCDPRSLELKTLQNKDIHNETYMNKWGDVIYAPNYLINMGSLLSGTNFSPSIWHHLLKVTITGHPAQKKVQLPLFSKNN